MKRRKKYGTRYPWKRWLGADAIAGQGARSFRLVRGTDYACRTDSMAQLVRQAASSGRWNVRVHIHIADDGESLTVIVDHT